MAKALIVYGSETGNTKRAAEMIADALRAAGLAVDVLDVTATTAAVLGQPYDLFLLGVSTWGAIDEEVTEDFKNFHEELRTAALAGKKFAVFGCGDTGYGHFCKAVDFVAERVAGSGGELVAEKLKINLDPKNSAADIAAWTKALAATLA